MEPNQVTADVNELLIEADEKRKALHELFPLTTAIQEKLRDDLRLQMTYDSNAIEGSKLTLVETARVLEEGALDIEGKSRHDVLAAKGFAEAFDRLFEMIEAREPLTESLIRELHRSVLLDAHPQCRGAWRTHAVRIAGASFRTADCFEIPYRIRELIDWAENARDIHPIERAARFHARFEAIHPFSDGNGRTGRLILNYMLLEAGFEPVNIRCAEDRIRYYAALEACQTKKDARPILELLLERELDALSRALCAH